jgi:hypothetical protein
LQLVDMSILLILLSPWPGCHTLTPLEDRRPCRSTLVQELPLLVTSMYPVPTHVPRRAIPSWTRPCIQCRPMCHDGPHVCTPDPHMPVLPRGSALIPNVKPQPPRGQAHSWVPGNNFPVGHPSPNCSGPSMLNPRFLWSEFPEKKFQLVDMSILLILLSPRSGCHKYPLSTPSGTFPFSENDFIKTKPDKS